MNDIILSWNGKISLVTKIKNADFTSLPVVISYFFSKLLLQIIPTWLSAKTQGMSWTQRICLSWLFYVLFNLSNTE